MTEIRTITSGFAFGESPRWHDGRLWFSDWVAGEIIAVDRRTGPARSSRASRPPRSASTSAARRPAARRVRRRRARCCAARRTGRWRPHADLSGLVADPWNEIVVDGRGNAYVNNIGFDFPDGEVRARASSCGRRRTARVREVADDLAFPNGMARDAGRRDADRRRVVRQRLTAFDIGAGRRAGRPAGLGRPRRRRAGRHLPRRRTARSGTRTCPHRRCVRVREGGEVLATVELDRGCFSCALGGPDGRTLFVVGQLWGEPSAEPSGRLYAVDV